MPCRRLPYRPNLNSAALRSAVCGGRWPAGDPCRWPQPAVKPAAGRRRAALAAAPHAGRREPPERTAREDLSPETGLAETAESKLAHAARTQSAETPTSISNH